jgi:hypothetical protein
MKISVRSGVPGFLLFHTPFVFADFPANRSARKMAGDLHCPIIRDKSERIASKRKLVRPIVGSTCDAAKHDFPPFHSCTKASASHGHSDHSGSPEHSIPPNVSRLLQIREIAGGTFAAYYADGPPPRIAMLLAAPVADERPFQSW